MENILLVMSGTKPDMCTLDFACYVSEVTHSSLRVLLGEGIKESDVPVLRELFALPYVETIVAGDIPENKIMRQRMEDNRKLIGEACRNRNVFYSIRRDFKISAAEIIRESRYADLVIISPETSMSGKNEGSPTRFVMDILTAAECPVLLSPYTFDGISEIAFPYDGSEDAVFAIKQFTHLFPALNYKPVNLIRVDRNSSQTPMETEELMFLLTSHYSNVKCTHLKGDPENELFTFLLGKKEMFVVMGAFGRSALSNIFRRSTALLSIQTVDLPFFIAHNTK
jgi:hypothetical protein